MRNLTAIIPIETVLAIDPGQTTGIALFRNAHLPSREVQTWAVPLDNVIEFLLPLLPVDGVVIEEPPGSSYSHFFQYATTLVPQLRRIFPSASWVRPGVWKQAPRSLRERDFSTQHEADAYNLGMYYISFLLPFRQAVRISKR